MNLEPLKVGGQWRVGVVAHVNRRDNPNIRFHAEGPAAHQRESGADGEGKAETSFNLPAGAWSLSATIVGTDVWSPSLAVTLGDKPRQMAGEIDMRGHNGRYVIAVRVWDADNRPAANVPVLFRYRRPDGQHVTERDKQTDVHGLVEREFFVPANEPVMYVEAWVPQIPKLTADFYLEPYRRPFWRRNNLRAAIFLAVSLVWLAGNGAFIGVVNDPKPAAMRVNPEAERLTNLGLRGEYKTNEELGIVKPQREVAGEAARWSWRLNITFLLFSLVYAPLALREELAGAGRRTLNLWRNRHKAVDAAGVVTEKPAAAVAQSPFAGRVQVNPEPGWWVYVKTFFQQLLASGLADIFTGHRF